MKLREKLEKIKPLEETTLKVKRLLGVYTMTGSFMFDVHTEDSDIDVMIRPDAVLTFSDVIQKHNGVYLNSGDDSEIDHYRQEDFESCYILIDGTIFNLLFFHKEETYMQWEYATKQILQLLESDKHYIFKNLIKDKQIRVTIFEKFKELYEEEV